jgi:predicted RNA-binding protein
MGKSIKKKDIEQFLKTQTFLETKDTSSIYNDKRTKGRRIKITKCKINSSDNLDKLDFILTLEELLNSFEEELMVHDIIEEKDNYGKNVIIQLKFKG